MNDLIELELNGFSGQRPMVGRVGATRPRPRPRPSSRLQAPSGAPSRTALTRSIVSRKASPKAVRARAIIGAQLAPTLGPALAGVIASAARRKFAATHGEQIEIADIGRRVREFKARAYMFLISPAVAAAANAFASNPSTLTAAVLKGAVAFGAEKAKEAGLLNAAETDAVKKLAPKAIERAIPAIIDQLGRLGDGEGGGDMLAELESRW